MWAFYILAVVFEFDTGIGFYAPALTGKRLSRIIEHFQFKSSEDQTFIPGSDATTNAAV